MNFQTFWNQLLKITSSEKEFFTLSRKKPFTATYHNETIVIKPSKIPVFERPLNRNEFFKVWSKASKLSAGERFEAINYHDDTFHSSYIVSLMKSVVKDDEITI